MIRSMFVMLAITLAVTVAPATVARAGEKDKGFSVKSQIVLPVHKVKMEKDRIYRIEVKAKGFTPQVTIPGTFFFSPDAAFGQALRDITTTFRPRETREYQVIVSPSLFGGNVPSGTLDYTLLVKPLVFAEKPLFKVADKLSNMDKKYPLRNGPHKAFPIKLKAGETYIIDMVRPGINPQLDPYLYLEDAKNKVVAQDDDGGGNLNARIIFTPKADGDYRIIATTFGLQATGNFTLTVRGTEPAKQE